VHDWGQYKYGLILGIVTSSNIDKYENVVLTKKLGITIDRTSITSLARGPVGCFLLLPGRPFVSTTYQGPETAISLALPIYQRKADVTSGKYRSMALTNR